MANFPVWNDHFSVQYRNVITGAVFVVNTLCNWFLMILTTPTPLEKAVKHKPYNASVLTSWYILFKYFKECTVHNNLDLLKLLQRKSGGALAPPAPPAPPCLKWDSFHYSTLGIGYTTSSLVSSDKRSCSKPRCFDSFLFLQNLRDFHNRNARRF